MGDPAGISAEITIKSWLLRRSKYIPPFVFFGSNKLLLKRAREMGLNIETKIIQDFQNFEPEHFLKFIPVFDIPIFDEKLGLYDEKNDSAIIASILHAIDFIKNNKINAIVTNPVNKNSLKHNKRQYNGQTELFADIFNSNQQVMLLTSDEMKVIPLTRHIPISLIPSSINKKLIIDTTIVGIESLKKYFNIAEPKVAITGLNPHAGDNGLIGSEEIEIITPAVEYLQKQSHSVSGPLSADSLFHDISLRKYDLIVCMYHDQALIPIKARSLYSAVNVTLGLDIIRTSPDHGTGYDIANKFIADESSLIEALILAEKMIKPHVK
jgi:4-hydroxythreonine-4-phosphate dehydrogenase